METVSKLFRCLVMATKCAVLKLCGESPEECNCSNCAAIWRSVLRHILGLTAIVALLVLFTGKMVSIEAIILTIGAFVVSVACYAAASDSPRKS